jgi:hypothetical protein
MESATASSAYVKFPRLSKWFDPGPAYSPIGKLFNLFGTFSINLIHFLLKWGAIYFFLFCFWHLVIAVKDYVSIERQLLQIQGERHQMSRMIFYKDNRDLIDRLDGERKELERKQDPSAAIMSATGDSKTGVKPDVKSGK